ncbi:MAG: glycosyltransferase family 4 protein [Woeseiaceae bacterium]
MTIFLYRRRLSLTSGAGQLIRMQAEGLRSEGQDVRVACSRGAFGFFLHTRLPVKLMSTAKLNAIAASSDHLVVDHQMVLPEADLVFVHNLTTEGLRHLSRDDWVRSAADEAEFFRALNPRAPVVANSELVKRGLIEHFALDPARVVVHYPGFSPDRFAAIDRGAPASAASRPEFARGNRETRLDARGSLGIGASVPLVGFVTSGDFHKRGLDIFLESAERIAVAKPEVRFLVVGAKRLPAWALRHPLVTNGRVLHRPKSGRPERWFAALDVFLYPARFEEFGMVVSEAQASGLPILTSRRVGAAECLPDVYEPWLVDEPEAAVFAEKALSLLSDEKTRFSLSAAGVASIASFDREHYVRATVGMIRECAREKGALSVSRANVR